VELDMTVWGLTLLVSVPLMATCLHLTLEGRKAAQCLLAWFLWVSASALTCVLGEELYRLMPSVPEDARQILNLFSGTSSQMLRRQISPEDAPHKFGAPGMGSGALRSWRGRSSNSLWARMSHVPLASYQQLFRLLAFWQAVCATWLIVSSLSEPKETLMSHVLECLTWLEWPLMLFQTVPCLVRYLTILNSIGDQVDEREIRKVVLGGKQGLLKDYMRLIQLQGFFGRAKERGEAWATCTGPGQEADARRALRSGLHKFRTLPASEQNEIWMVYLTWDVDYDEGVSAEEIRQRFHSMGFVSEASMTDGGAAPALVRLVDHDGTGELSWEKFQAMASLATVDRPEKELSEDIHTFFELIDTDGDEKVTVVEITHWLQSTIQGSINENDVASLLYKHFATATNTVSQDEFEEWIHSLVAPKQTTSAVH